MVKALCEMGLRIHASAFTGNKGWHGGALIGHDNTAVSISASVFEWNSVRMQCIFAAQWSIGRPPLPAAHWISSIDTACYPHADAVLPPCVCFCRFQHCIHCSDHSLHILGAHGEWLWPCMNSVGSHAASSARQPLHVQPPGATTLLAGECRGWSN